MLIRSKGQFAFYGVKNEAVPTGIGMCIVFIVNKFIGMCFNEFQKDIMKANVRNAEF